ncbi:MAG: cupin domain-containing protein [Chitinophagaceae bacterium]
MKRKQFLLSTLAVTAIPTVPFAQSPEKQNDAGKGFKIPAGDGRLHGHIKLKGVNANVLDLKVSGTDNNNGFALFEQTSLSPGRGTPLHVHHKQDEVFYVLEGNYYFQVGEEKFQLGAGDSIFMPMKVPHAWTQVSEKGKMMVLFQPAGKMENFFITVAGMGQEPTPAGMAKCFADNEMQIVGPPLQVPA